MLLLGCFASSVNPEEAPKVRVYTGNLSVGYFMEYWGTGKQSPGDIATPEYCQRMKSVSVSATCDYLAWCRIEPEPGKWEWSFYDRNERVLHAHGLLYNVFCWLHFPPKWFMETAEYVPYRCVEHDEPIQQTSLWAPGTLRAYERFYKALSENFGDRIDFIRLAAPAEYGEIGYPSGMTDWLVKQEHKHAGFWCNDPHARMDFRAAMKRRYRTASKLNSAWGAGFKSFDEIEFPPCAKDHSRFGDPLRTPPGARRWMLDFIGWYYESQINFARKAVGIVRRNFPGKEIILSMGYGSQMTMYGNDDVGVAKMCRDLKTACQTPGNIPYFCMKSLASPCGFYGVPYFTEPPGAMNPTQEVDRIWSDASCGTQTYFDYPGNLLGAKEVLAKYGRYLDGSKAIVDMAAFFPTTDHRLRNQDWPHRTMAGANALREYLDYDLIDERMVREGALSKYAILLMFDGNVMEASTLKALEKWLKDGGILAIRDFGPIETVEGDRTFYNRWIAPVMSRAAGRSSNLVHKSAVGKGWILAFAGGRADHEVAAGLADLAHDLSELSPGKRDVPKIDDIADAVTATLFPHRILYLNPTDRQIEKTIRLRESDFPDGGRTGRPVSWTRILKLKPHSIAEIRLM